MLFFGYYEGFRNTQGMTTSATVPTALERQGDFSQLGVPLLNLAAGGVPFPGNKIPEAAINPVSRNVLNMYPLGNVSPSIYRETVILENDYDQTGGRLDFTLSPDNQIFGRYSYSGGNNLNPVSVRGTDVPGFPTRDDFATHHATVSNTRILSPSLTSSLRGTFLRHEFFFDQRLNRTPPSALGFGYESSNEVGQGPPFFNVSGYSPIGGAITGPRNTTQHTVEVQNNVAWTKRSHLVKIGGEFRHTSIDMVQAIAPNAFYVFAGTFPTNNAVANLLLGAPVTFYQGHGDFARDVRVWNGNAYAQDEWRLNPRLTLNYGLRYERINPFTEIEDRLNGFIPGVQSRVRPDAPVGTGVSGRPGIGCGIADSVHAFMPRGGFAWDPTGSGVWSVRGAYGLFYDQFQNGAGTSSQVAISATPWAQFVQFSGAGLNFQNPYLGRPPARGGYVRPAVHGLRARPRGEAAVRAELERRASNARSSAGMSWRLDTSAPGAGTCRGTSRRTLPCSVRERRRRMPTGVGSMPAARRTAAPARCPPSRCCGASRDRVIRRVRRASRGASATRGVQRVVLVLANVRSSLRDESFRRGGAAARRRERSGAESVRSRRRMGSVLVRRAASHRRQRELDSAHDGETAPAADEPCWADGR